METVRERWTRQRRAERAAGVVNATAAPRAYMAAELYQARTACRSLFRNQGADDYPARARILKPAVRRHLAQAAAARAAAPSPAIG